MKKILTLLAVVTGATLAHGQGTVIFNNISAVYAMRTNATVDIHGNPTGSGTSGVTAKTATQFYYALLFTPYGGPVPSTNPLDPAWAVHSVLANNSTLAFGGVAGPGGGGGTAIPGWGAPTGSTADTAERNYFMIVGWSANLGNTWAAISARIAEDFETIDWTGNAFYGTSVLGNGYSGGGPFAVTAPSLFGVTAAMPGGLTSGFNLNLVPVPEPTTYALLGLGSAALMIFRRRR